MPGNSPARLLAPLALALAALALLFVVCSGSGDDDFPVSGTPNSTTAPKEGKRDRPARRKKRQAAETYTVQSGDTPASVADDQGVSVDALLEANPDIDPVGLAVGDELEIPRE